MSKKLQEAVRTLVLPALPFLRKVIIINSMDNFLEYEVLPGDNVPGGLPPMRLAVLSAVWEGPSLILEYPDGEGHILVGWSGPGEGRACNLRIFWTRHQAAGPAVCLAIGGDAGLKDFCPASSTEPLLGRPFLALAEGMIPAEVLEVIGPPPAPALESAPLLLLA